MFSKYLRSAIAESVLFPLSSSVPLTRSLYQTPYANFARKIPAKKPLANLTETMEKKEKERKKFSVVEDTFPNREDPKSQEIDDQWLSLFYLPAQHLPEKFLRRAHKVFAKFPQSDVRKMGKSYMKLYQFLHAAEKPTDLTGLPPFANTVDVLTGRKSMIHLGKKYRYTEPPKNKDEKEKLDKLNSEKMDRALNDNTDPEKGSDQGINYDQNTALAFLQRKVPHTFGVACRILTEIKYRLPDFKPKTFLDFGAGLGSGSWAFQDVFREFDKVVAIEPAAPMRKLGKYLTQDIGKIDWFDSLARLINVHDIDGTFDIVYCGFVLEEVKTPEARQLIIDTLWQKVNPGGIMILAEPGSPKGFRFVHDFRQMIVEMPRIDANIIAPCPHHHACPQAKPGHLWCNFDQAVAKYPNKVFTKLAKQSTIDHERFSYLAARKGEIVKEITETSTPAEKSFFWPRLLRPTVKRGRHVIMDLCTTEGEIERRIIAKSHQEEGQFKQAKKMKWGDLWCFGKRIPNKFRKEEKRGERLF